MSPASPRARAPGGGWEASGRIRPGWAVLKLPLLARKLWWIRTTGHFEHISEAADAGAERDCPPRTWGARFCAGGWFTKWTGGDRLGRDRGGYGYEDRASRNAQRWEE